jgi:hypothetical protein
MRRNARNLLAGLAAVAMGAPCAHAADFYAGKTVDFVVGADVGGGFDIYARTISRHLGRFVPGKPTFVPRNNPGAGSAVAAAPQIVTSRCLAIRGRPLSFQSRGIFVLVDRSCMSKCRLHISRAHG